MLSRLENDVKIVQLAIVVGPTSDLIQSLIKSNLPEKSKIFIFYYLLRFAVRK